MNIIFGSARLDENGNIYGGKVGDQKQTSTPDYKGEVSMQKFYEHTKGWYVMRAKSAADAVSIAERMEAACNNKCLGYDQYNRTGVIKYGIDTDTNTECDCSALVRACVKEATGKDPGNFTTWNEVSVLESTGLFKDKIEYKTGMKLYTGDILVTKTKGHTGIIVSGYERTVYYDAYNGDSVSIVVALRAVGEKDTTKAHRARIAEANGIEDYSYTAKQNTYMLNLLKEGKLIKA